MKISIRWLTICAAVLLALTGCANYPADPDHTLQRVTHGTLRVGVSHNEPYTSVTGPSPSGSEVDLVEQYARTLDAKIEWTEGGEEDLVTRMEKGQLDLVIGGLTKDTPWQKKVGLTRPYAETTNEFGQTEKHVLAIPLGENAFLLNLDRFLQDRKATS